MEMIKFASNFKTVVIMKKSFFLFLCMLLGTTAFSQEPDVPGNDNTPTTFIDGLQYKLNDVTLTAMVANVNSWEGELDIPERVTYDGKTYTVDRIEWLAFMSCKTLTKVRIPKTVVKIKHYANWEDCQNPFIDCTSLERIDVDEENPYFCAVDGVLFSKDQTHLCCYPPGAKREEYAIPDGVTWIGGDAFAYNPYLVKVTMPKSVARMSFGIFSNCKALRSVSLSENISHIAAYTFEKCESLHFLDIPESVRRFEESVFRWSPIKTLVIRGTFPNGFRYDTFYFMDDEVVIYVQQSEVEKLKSELAKLKSFAGTVLPLEAYHPTETDIPGTQECAIPTIAYDNGRLVFSCETPGAECVYEIKCSDNVNGSGGEVSLSQTYEIRVHATLDGYEDSDVAVATIGWHNGRPVMEGFSSVILDEDGNCDVNGDGTIDVADIARIIDSMAR